MKVIPPRGQYLKPRQIHEVFIMGGTHGNERTGIHVLQAIRNNIAAFTVNSIDTVKLLYGNPRAALRNSRFIDVDLNRSFQYDYNTGKKGPLEGYEARRALAIRKEIGALTAPVDFLIDLHTTTANMKKCFIVSDRDPWTRHLCRSLCEKLPDARVLVEDVPREEERTSSALGLNQVTLEMGPVGQGVTRYKDIKEMADTVNVLLHCVDALNGVAIREGVEVPRQYKALSLTVDYPRDKMGLPTAVIHKDFWHRDYKPIRRGDPVFTLSTGETIVLDDNPYFPKEILQAIDAGRTLCPIFIGEAAYIEKGIAFICAEPD